MDSFPFLSSKAFARTGSFCSWGFKFCSFERELRAFIFCVGISRKDTGGVWGCWLWLKEGGVNSLDLRIFAGWVLREAGGVFALRSSIIDSKIKGQNAERWLQLDIRLFSVIKKKNIKILYKNKSTENFDFSLSFNKSMSKLFWVQFRTSNQ